MPAAIIKPGIDDRIKRDESTKDEESDHLALLGKTFQREKSIRSDRHLCGWLVIKVVQGKRSSEIKERKAGDIWRRVVN